MQLNLKLPRGISPDIVKGYCLFHQLESWFRELVYLELKAHYGLSWWKQASDALKRNKAGGIAAQKSLKNDNLHPHMSTAENDPLWYLSFDSILKIVFDQKLWPLFLPYLTTKKLLRAKLEEIKPIRNRIAHCRSLHKDDLSRIEALLRDLDQGFWKFCTSYNDEKGFIAHLREDLVFKHFSEREHVPYAEVKPGKWARIGGRFGIKIDLILGYSIRPSTKRKKFSKVCNMKGAIYEFTFSNAHTGQGLEYEKILMSTKHWHNNVLHIFLDSFQGKLRVTFPAVIGSDSIIPAAEDFYQACLHWRGGTSYRNRQTDNNSEETSDPWEEYEKTLRPFELMAAEWPHYVIPPDHPFEFLCPDMPCTFFDKV